MSESLKNYEGKRIEHEKSSSRYDLIADFVRHGKPKYTEAEEVSGQLEGVLTEEGVEQANRIGHELADKIDVDNERVVIWASGKNRAKQTSKIIYDVLKDSGVALLTSSSGGDRGVRTRESLRDIKTEATDPSDYTKGSPFWDAIYYANKAGEKLSSGEDVGFDRWLEFWVEKDSEGELPQKTESPEELKWRSVRVLTYLERIARKIKPEDGKRLRFIVVGHEEGVRDLLEESFGVGTKKGTGPAYAEVVEVGVSTENSGSRFDVTFRDEKKELAFDPKSRKIERIEE
jgi:broad specificity phosphatase PhoE